MTSVPAFVAELVRAAGNPGIERSSIRVYSAHRTFIRSTREKL
jgi:hypothetical protein